MLPAKRHKTESESGSVLARALDRLQAHRRERRRNTRLGFLIDATGSRNETWEQAQGIHASMFRAVAGLGNFQVRLVHFGGGKLSDHGWMAGSREVAAAFAGVRCISGCTQILSGLAAFLEAKEGERPSAIILIGDCFEEDAGEASRIALDLNEAGIRVYCFLEGEDTTAEGVFREIAETTGGRMVKFGSELPLADLCAGVALLTAGGEKAAHLIENEKARRLLLTGPKQK
ncbi:MULTISPECIES: hypothetical protein [unclassified Mesorhizobium]|uniref:VWA domain-containing protein n=1 Tax=unclassified Mesorhizobium TaxID=325217 RepID=UPI002416D785|nr:MULTISPECIES: hypothetical protein [unclassified Mesorhizobium]MDG4901416.1 hypothetical protein [Mesorhizobium sp. WSM4962]MDG4918904.1 hypothetical protein [Mesorhizobium sp. WSM4989]